MADIFDKVFDKVFETLLLYEGGYVNDPKDPGGETKYGISRRSFPQENIKGLSKERAKEIYKKDFWQPLLNDLLPMSLLPQLFDCAVNQGPATAKKLLQRAVGEKEDGIIGPKTREKIAKVGPEELNQMFCLERILRYTGTDNFDRYGRGWIKRALHMCWGIKC